MALEIHWFLPTSGDSRTDVGTGHQAVLEVNDGAGSTPGRKPDIRYLNQISTAADSFGFGAVLTPTNLLCEDAWVISAALVQNTDALRYIVAFRPGLASPTAVAQMAASLQRISCGRLMLNVVVGGLEDEQRAFGDFLPKAERYDRASEYLSILRALWTGDSVNFRGEHVEVAGAQIRPSATMPRVYLGGSSAEAIEVAAKHADVFLTWGEPPEMVREKIARVRAQADSEGRAISFGIRMHVISRDTSEQAWQVAQQFLDAIDPEYLAKAQSNQQQFESEGQRRMRALHEGTATGLEVVPNLWAGFGLVRDGAGTGLVGSHAEVADLVAEYHEIGIDEFILSGFPHLEELYHVGEGLLPELRRRGLLRGGDQFANQFRADAVTLTLNRVQS